MIPNHPKIITVRQKATKKGKLVKRLMVDLHIRLMNRNIRVAGRTIEKGYILNACLASKWGCS
jgi:hypothetical protein